MDDLEQLNSLPDGSRKQGTTHIPVTAEQVLQSDGEERFKWMCAGRKDLDNLFGRVSTSDLNTAMMRYLVSWRASSPDFTLASLDVTAAFLNAPLLEGRVVILKPPEGESYSVILSQIHKSLCVLVKTKFLLKNPSVDQFGLTNLVLLEHVEAMSGIYVDDYFTAGPPKFVEAFMNTLRKLWKTSEPQFLSFDHN